MRISLAIVLSELPVLYICVDKEGREKRGGGKEENRRDKITSTGGPSLANLDRPSQGFLVKLM